MSMSRSPEKRYAEEPIRGSHDRPDVDQQPAKRLRADTQKEDRARGKRLFGNLLGTLQQFKKDDKTSRTSVAAKRREEIAEKIQKKIRSETTLHHEIAEAEKELKSLRILTDSSEFILKHKEAAMIARHTSLKPISHFLHSALPVPAPSVFEGDLLDPSPIPLNGGPTNRPAGTEILRPLYFLPKILLPHQRTALDQRIANVSEIITEESQKLSTEKSSTTEIVKRNRARVEELVSKLSVLRAQIKPEQQRGDRDDFGRTSRGRMEVDTAERSGQREASQTPAGRETQDEIRDREAGVQIRGEDGDVEVEY